jgi:hypothetical protein
MDFPPGLEKLYRMTDEEITLRLSKPTPQVAQKR